MANIKYPIGIQSFSSLREGGYVYVDKTRYLQLLLDSGTKYVFLSRPRRFGKSLFLSMVEAFFRGRKELFAGLDISHYSYDWCGMPVFHIDLTGMAYNSKHDVRSRLNATMAEYEEQYGIGVENTENIGLRFERLIKEVHEKYGLKVVVLVDEYDKPLLETVDNPELQKLYMADLRSFYSNLKSQDAHIHFAMLTGVTKFGHLSVFSDLNNLRDISMLRQFSGVCGITNEELRKYFKDGVAALAQGSGWTEDEAFESLKRNYDGYHFAPEGGDDVYNPFSILNALSADRISNYWFQTGTPTFLVKMIKSKGLPIRKLEDTDVDVDSIASVSFDLQSSLYPVLYQAGYLTIKGYKSLLNRVRLGFPNREVEEGFFKQLAKIYVPANRSN